MSAFSPVALTRTENAALPFASEYRALPAARAGE